MPLVIDRLQQSGAHMLTMTAVTSAAAGGPVLRAGPRWHHELNSRLLPDVVVLPADSPCFCGTTGRGLVVRGCASVAFD